VSQVLDELGLQLTDQLSGLPQASGSLAASGVKATPIAAAAGGGGGVAGGGGPGAVNDADADLQARLDNLRRE
jgi:charged multivesicular body protein 2A